MTEFDEVLEKVKKDRKEKSFCLCHTCIHRDAEQQYMWKQFKDSQDKIMERIKNND